MKSILRVILLILILLFAGLSFGPCIRETQQKLEFPNGDDNELSIESDVRDSGFYPVFTCVVSFFEILLLFIDKRFWPKIVRFILNLIKTVTPVLSVWAARMLWTMFDIDFFAAPPTYTILRTGHLVIGIGILIAFFTILDMFPWKTRKKPERKEKLKTGFSIPD